MRRRLTIAVAILILASVAFAVSSMLDSVKARIGQLEQEISRMASTTVTGQSGVVTVITTQRSDTETEDEFRARHASRVAWAKTL